MEKNIGDFDRGLRISLALVLMAFGIVYDQTLLFIPAFVLFVTGLVGTCPLYSLLGITTKTYLDYPAVSQPSTPVAVEIEESINVNQEEPKEEKKPEPKTETINVSERRKRRKELFEEDEGETSVEEEKPAPKKRRRNVRRKSKSKKD